MAGQHRLHGIAKHFVALNQKTGKCNKSTSGRVAVSRLGERRKLLRVAVKFRPVISTRSCVLHLVTYYFDRWSGMAMSRLNNNCIVVFSDYPGAARARDAI